METMTEVKPFSDQQDGVSRSIREEQPTHFLFKIQSFSLFSKASIERYDSADFEAGGYTWKLSLYPNGNEKKNGKGHISLYLVMAETKKLPRGWEVSVLFRFFLLDQIRDNYLMVQDTKKTGRRFHGMKTEWGFDKLISHEALTDASNGYLVDDKCVFGAEVFVCKERSTGKGECLSMIKDAVAGKYTWKKENFSKLDSECYESSTFNAGNHKWKIQLYPKGKGINQGRNLSLFLALADSVILPPGRKIYADCTLRLMDQMYANHISGKVSYWFSASSTEFGYGRFITLTHLYQSSIGYLVKDTCIFEAEVTVIGMADTLP